MNTVVEMTVVEMTFPPFSSKISCYVSLLILVLELALNIHKLHIIKLTLSSYFYVHVQYEPFGNDGQ